MADRGALIKYSNVAVNTFTFEPIHRWDHQRKQIPVRDARLNLSSAGTSQHTPSSVARFTGLLSIPRRISRPSPAMLFQMTCKVIRKGI